MDSLTQAALGAAIGQTFAPRLGRKATWWGALGGLVPDFDILSVPLTGPWGELVWHRGPTHSLWFGPVVGTLIGYAMWRWYRRRTGADPQGPGGPAAFRPWILLWVLALLTHPLLDAFTTYGTQLLSPFADTRFAFNGVAIIDPLYTVPLAIALIVGRFARTRPQRARRAALVALTLTTAYLGYGTWQNHRAHALAVEQLAAEGTAVTRVAAFPTLFQPWLRRVVAWREGSVQVGDVSTFTPRPLVWQLHEFPANSSVSDLQATPEAALFRWFADGHLAPLVLPRDDGFTVRLADLRYGFPGSADGFWGMERDYAADGAPQGPVRRYRNPPPPVGATLKGLWRATFP